MVLSGLQGTYAVASTGLRRFTAVGGRDRRRRRRSLPGESRSASTRAPRPRAVLGRGDRSGQSVPARLHGCSGRWWRVSAERWLKLELVGGTRGQVLLAPSDPRSLRAALDCRPAQPTAPPARPWRTRTRRARPDRQHGERDHRRGPRPLRGRARRRTSSTGLIWACGSARLAGQDRLRAPARRAAA